MAASFLRIARALSTMEAQARQVNTRSDNSCDRSLYALRSSRLRSIDSILLGVACGGRKMGNIPSRADMTSV